MELLGAVVVPLVVASPDDPLPEAGVLLVDEESVEPVAGVVLVLVDGVVELSVDPVAGVVLVDGVAVPSVVPVAGVVLVVDDDELLGVPVAGVVPVVLAELSVLPDVLGVAEVLLLDGGIKTVSIAWMTPLLAGMSAWVTVAPFTMTLPPELVILSVPP